MESSVQLKPLAANSPMIILGRTSELSSMCLNVYLYCHTYVDAGKSVLLRELINNFSRIFNSDIGRLLIVYETWQEDIYERMILPAKVKVHKFHGLSEEIFSKKMLKDPKGHLTVVIFDDMVTSLLRRKFEDQVSRLVVVQAHHWNVAPIFVLQSVSFKVPSLSLLLNNARYIFVSFYNTTVPTALAQLLQVNT